MEAPGQRQYRTLSKHAIHVIGTDEREDYRLSGLIGPQQPVTTLVERRTLLPIGSNRTTCDANAICSMTWVPFI